VLLAVQYNRGVDILEHSRIVKTLLLPWELLGNRNKIFTRYHMSLSYIYDSHVHLPFSDELVNEKEKYKGITDELDQTFSELASY